MIKSDGINIPEDVRVTAETSHSLPDIEIQKTVDSPSIKPRDIDKEPAEAAAPLSKPMSFEKSKSQEIASHLKTVMLVSVLCLIIVSFLYFLELRIHWVEQILLSPFFSGK
jgi:hypothetical protein